MLAVSFSYRPFKDESEFIYGLFRCLARLYTNFFCNSSFVPHVGFAGLCFWCISSLCIWFHSTRFGLVCFYHILLFPVVMPV